MVDCIFRFTTPKTVIKSAWCRWDFFFISQQCFLVELNWIIKVMVGLKLISYNMQESLTAICWTGLELEWIWVSFKLKVKPSTRQVKELWKHYGFGPKCVLHIICQNVWLKKDVLYWFRSKADILIALPSSVSEWYGCILTITSIDLLPPSESKHLNDLFITLVVDGHTIWAADLFTLLKTNIPCKLTDIFRMSSLYESF